MTHAPTLDTIYYASTYVSLLFDYVSDQGIDAERVLGEPRPVNVSGVQVTTGAHWQALLLRAADALDDPQLGLHLGQTITPAHLGALGYVFTACEHVGAALLRWQQFERLISSLTMVTVNLSPDTVEIAWVNVPKSLGALVDETALTAIVQFTRVLTGTASMVEEICFMHPAPADPSPYEQYFGGNVRFGQATTCIRFPLRLLQMPVRQPDAALLAMMEQQASALLAQLPAMDDLEQRTRELVARLARSGEVSIERVAEAMHMTSRTLHRHLSRRGLQFRLLRDDTLQRLAQSHLRDARLSIAEVAWLLGYSEHSAFTRAFKRWTGVSPQHWRETALARA